MSKNGGGDHNLCWRDTGQTHSSILEKLVVRVTCDPHFIIQAAVKAS